MDPDKKLKSEKHIYDVHAWLNIHVNHLSYARNLVLVLATAEIGFLAQLIVTENNWAKSNMIPIRIILVVSIASVLLGLILAWLTERNFRIYRKVSRVLNKSDKWEDAKNEISPLKKRSTTIERVNECLFTSQLLLFLAGTFILAILIW